MSILIFVLSGIPVFSSGGQEEGSGITWDLAATGEEENYTVGSDGYLQNGVGWEDSTRFEAVNEEVVIDFLTGLMWYRGCDELTRSWANALQKADTFNGGGFDDWRLPNVREIRSLLHYGRYTPDWLSDVGFVNIDDGEYWTSTTFFNDTASAWYINLYTGESYPALKTSLKRLLLVR